MPVITTRWLVLWRCARRDFAPSRSWDFPEADTKGYYHEAISGLPAEGAALCTAESSTCCVREYIARQARLSMRDFMCSFHSRALFSAKSRAGEAGRPPSKLR